MRCAIVVWMLLVPVAVHVTASATPLNQYASADLVVAGTRGALRGAIESLIPDDRLRLPIRWDTLCCQNPLAKGCI
ncbi:MAG: hypothetical protein H0T46_04945 [Deltaproteobacteria bacterium]|nr:hypothetical protein [Deltaproteobacteria bacterium]